MSRTLKWLLVLGLLAWYLNDPVPEGFSDPWKLRLHMARNKAVLSVMWGLSELNIVQYETAIRSSLRYLESISPKPEPSDKLVITDESFDGVNVRVYRPAGKSPDNAGYRGLVFYHGGGWFLASVELYDKHMLAIAEEVDIVVVSVDYRLSPEHVFPEPLNDCIVATKYFMKNSHNYDVDPGRIAIGGDSAGGNLAAAVALYLRDNDFTPMPKHQLLLYPVIQCVDFFLPSYMQNTHGPLIDRYNMALACSLYATGSSKYTTTFAKNYHTTPEAKRQLYSATVSHADLPEKNRYKPYSEPSLDYGDAKVWHKVRPALKNPYFSPIMADDFRNLPDTFLFTAQYDVLRDEGFLYGHKLAQAGNNVTHINSQTGFHGLCTLRQYEEGRACFSDLTRYIENSL